METGTALELASTPTGLTSRDGVNLAELAANHESAETARTRAGSSNTTRAHTADLAKFGRYAAETYPGFLDAQHLAELERQEWTESLSDIDDRGPRSWRSYPELRETLADVGSTFLLSARREDPETFYAVLHGFVGRMRRDELSPTGIDRAIATLSAQCRKNRLGRIDRDEALSEAIQGAGVEWIDNGHKTERAKPLSRIDLRAIVQALDLSTKAGIRDRALLTVWYWGALRRSELVSLRLPDVTFSDRGVELTLRNTKTNSGGIETANLTPTAGEWADICPVIALREWAEVLAEATGPAFRRLSRAGTPGGYLTAQGAVNVLIARATAANVDTARMSGHSPRRGLATDLVDNGATILEVERAGRWARGSKAAGLYFDEAERWGTLDVLTGKAGPNSHPDA